MGNSEAWNKDVLLFFNVHLVGICAYYVCIVFPVPGP